MKLHLEIYDPADPDAPPRVAPEGTEFEARWPNSIGTIDPQWGRVGDTVKIIDDESGVVAGAFIVVDRLP